RDRARASLHLVRDRQGDVRRLLRDTLLVRVGIDVSPPVQTRAGTARFLAALLERNEYERFSWGGPGKLATVARDAWWYPLALPRRPRGAEAPHCPTSRAP